MSIRLAVSADLKAAYDAAVADWQSNNKVDRFWKKDPSLWTREDEGKWMGWIDIVGRQQKDLETFAELGGDVESADFSTVLLLGMGGSSLCPEVLAKTFGQKDGFPALRIVDSTDPVQIMSVCNEINLAETLVIVSSKSGSTLEPNILKQFFFSEITRAVGEDEVGNRFIAITDPGSKMEQVAKNDKFRDIFYGDPEIGGRYSALSNFGLIPATASGLDVQKLLDEAAKGVADAKKEVAANAGVQLGLLLGTAHNAGRNKITIFTSPEIHDLGAWLEQLIAESTGKQGKGITPVDRETIGAPAVYGKDRVFAYVRLANTADTSQDAKVDALEAAGNPVVRFEIGGLYEIFSQFFTWEIATAVAGSVMGINPFNQPDVEAAKVETRALTAEYEKTGKLPARTPFLTGEEEGGVPFALYATDAYAAKLKAAAPSQTLTGIVRAHLDQLKAGDYFATVAFLPMFEEHEEAIQEFRLKVRDKKQVATCLGFGPRFLHSTGQDYKGGPNTGVFLQLTGGHADDVDIPGQSYSFGIVIDAQAAGDLAVLESRGRRALRVHLGKDIGAGLKALNAAFSAALS
jgi:glucose-6-phosphate isomerase